MTLFFALKYAYVTLNFSFFRERQWFLILIKHNVNVFFDEFLPSANLVINLNFFFLLYRFNYGTVTSLIIKKWGEKIFEP